MNAYRIFLLEQAKIVTSLDFSIEDEDRALRAAAIVFDACRDDCDECELWEGARLIATAETLNRQGERQAGAGAAKAGGALVWDPQDDIARMAATLLEKAIKTSVALRASPRLNARLETLRRAGE